MTAPINYCGNEAYPLNPTTMPTGPRTDDNSPSGVTLRSADAFTPDESGESEQVQADWDQSDSSAVDYIKNKPTIVEFEQVQANWNESDSSAVDYIKNKPTIVDVPTLPTEDGSYVLKITSGVASWVAES